MRCLHKDSALYKYLRLRRKYFLHYNSSIMIKNGNMKVICHAVLLKTSLFKNGFKNFKFSK